MNRYGRALVAGLALSLLCRCVPLAQVDRKAPGLGTTPMHDAAWTGDVERIRALAEQQPALIDQATTSDHDTPLILAVINGRKAAVRALVEEGADVNASDKKGGTPLSKAVHHMNCPQTVEFVLDHGANVDSRDYHDRTALYWAQDADIARLLIARGADVKTTDDVGWTALHVADNPLVAQQLITHGADVEARCHAEETPLVRLAGAYGDPAETIRALLAHGAQVNVRNFENRTALHGAARMGNTKTAKLLIEAGADLNARQDNAGWTPLHSALYRGHPDVAKLLINSGADINARDGDGKTPLHFAKWSGLGSVVWLLKSKGAVE